MFPQVQKWYQVDTATATVASGAATCAATTTTTATKQLTAWAFPKGKVDQVDTFMGQFAGDSVKPLKIYSTEKWMYGMAIAKSVHVPM